MTEQANQIIELVDALEGPQDIKVGENIYDQIPFQEVLSDTEDKTKLGKATLRTMLTMVAKDYEKYLNNGGKATSIGDFIAETNNFTKLDEVDEITRKLKLKKERKSEIQESLNLMIPRFQNSPFWWQYLARTIVNGYYKSDGTDVQNISMPVKADSYVKFVNSYTRMMRIK